MDTALSSTPIRARRRLAVATGLFAALFVAVGFAAATGGTAWTIAFSVIAFVVAVLLALISWGLAHSVTVDGADAELDAAIDAALHEHGGRASMCNCAVAHDPGELQVTDAECSHDGSGAACAHDCTTCVLAALRTAPSTGPAQR